MSIEHSDDKVIVRRTIDAPAAAIFAVLTNPAKHPQFDGSGMVQASTSQPVTALGEVFQMKMYAEFMGGEYQTDNTVVAYEPDRIVGWQPAPSGTEPLGWQWVYELASGQAGTEVSLTYEWSAVTDDDLRSKMPAISPKKLEESLARLESLVA